MAAHYARTAQKVARVVRGLEDGRNEPHAEGLRPCNISSVVEIQLCKKSIERLAPGLAALISTLRDREHTPVVKDCLNRCQRCDLGGLLAVADGMPLSAPTFEGFLSDLDALAADDA
jgi:hypothetical protein